MAPKMGERRGTNPALAEHRPDRPTPQTYTPHLPAEVNPDSPKGTQWRLPCLHCSSAPGRRGVVYHYHAAGEGDRVAHCIFEGSPYRETGYVVVYDPERAQAIAAALRRPRAA